MDTAHLSVETEEREGKLVTELVVRLELTAETARELAIKLENSAAEQETY